MNELEIAYMVARIETLIAGEVNVEAAYAKEFSDADHRTAQEAAWRVTMRRGGVDCRLPISVLITSESSDESPHLPLFVEKLRALPKQNSELMNKIKPQVVDLILEVKCKRRTVLKNVLLLICGGGAHIEHDEVIAVLSSVNTRLVLCGFWSSNLSAKAILLETVDKFINRINCVPPSAWFFYNTLILLSAHSEERFVKLSANLRAFNATGATSDSVGAALQPATIAGAALKFTNLSESIISQPKVVNLALPAAVRRVPLIAVCVSGQLRGYEKAIENWKQRGFWGANFVRYVHVWSSVGRREPEAMHLARCFTGATLECVQSFVMEHGFETFRGLYPELFRIFTAGPKADVEVLQAKFETDHVVIEDEALVDFSKIARRVNYFRNNAKMHYKMEKSYDLFRDSGIDADLVVRMRPDREVLLTRFDWGHIADRCRHSRLLFCDFDRSIADFGYFIGDQQAIGAGEAAEIYNRSFSRVVRDGVTDGSGLPRQLNGHETLSMLTLLEGIVIRNSPLRLGEFLEMGPVASQELIAGLQADLTKREHRRIDSDLLDAIHKDLSHSA